MRGIGLLGVLRLFWEILHGRNGKEWQCGSHGGERTYVAMLIVSLALGSDAAATDLAAA